MHHGNSWTLAGALLLGAWSGLALAWGSEGHQVVARLAERNLSAPARAKLDKLLALEPGTTLPSISTWADEHRSPSTSRWHYVNFPRGSCDYEPARDCPDNACIVAQIDRQEAVLESSPSPESRLKALKYLVHFVGDIHQPLHAGYADDKGGNTYQLQAFGRGTNLHKLWDSTLLDRIEPDAGKLAARLAASSPSARSSIGPADPVAWAEESCRVVATPGFYPARKLPADYEARYRPMVEDRLRLAGRRLAMLLNAALGTGSA